MAKSSYQVSDSEFVYGTQVTYSCEIGFEIVGLPVSTCQAEGIWSDRPSCREVSCPEIEYFANGEPLLYY